MSRGLKLLIRNKAPSKDGRRLILTGHCGDYFMEYFETQYADLSCMGLSVCHDHMGIVNASAQSIKGAGGRFRRK